VALITDVPVQERDECWVSNNKEQFYDKQNMLLDEAAGSQAKSLIKHR